MTDYNDVPTFDMTALRAASRTSEPMPMQDDKRLNMLRQLIDAEAATEQTKARYKKMNAELREVSEEIERLYAVQAELRRDLGISLGFSDGSENCQATEGPR